MHRVRLGAVLAVVLIGLTFFVVAELPVDGDRNMSHCGNYTAPFEVDHTDAYDRTTVVLYDADGTKLANVQVRIADTPDKRQTGLSETATLAEGEGMLFVHPSEDRYSYWMKGMSFPVDIIFVTANGEITTVHHAPSPDEMDGYGDFPGRGKYGLEVKHEWTDALDLEVGDCLAVPAGVSGG